MMETTWKPTMVKLSPVFKKYLWGGTRLHQLYGMGSPDTMIAESWQLSAHPAGQSVIAGGEYQGMLFLDYLEAAGKQALGWKCDAFHTFPFLIKFIDAHKNLSVQVHPTDEYALQYEQECGKNELWYVIDADQDAGLYVGFNRETNREEVRQKVADGTIMQLLNFYPAKPGDIFFIPAGTVHAIGAGSVICEIQQSSNCTYRLYDYNRTDSHGKTRELHLEKALDVLDFHPYERELKSNPQNKRELRVHDQEPYEEKSKEEKKRTYRNRIDTKKQNAYEYTYQKELFENSMEKQAKLIGHCKYFQTVLYENNWDQESKIAMDGSSFYSLVCIQGNGKINCNDVQMDIQAGESIFVPAVQECLKIEGKVSLMASCV